MPSWNWPGIEQLLLLYMHETAYPDRPAHLGSIVMNRSLLLVGLLAVLVSTGAFARPSPIDETPSPTVVYGDLVTVGSAPMGDVPNSLRQSEAGGHG